ncbi:MAG TPA: ThuA domain-containing protein [Candidatus Hydrogenedentes bacterium]|mgnify:CR=1 FL=1|nr:ThuA domain-containing protein [Candidatus Hydrogenedentota bacterium]HPG65712.1 ThuA domain-containing protein [Candidatus Hydrogenedentota bacterium]
MKQAVVLMTLACAAWPAIADEAPLRVLLLSGKNNHDWRATTPAVKELLEASGRFTVDVTEDPAACTAESLAPYAVIVDNWCSFPEMTGRPWGDAMERAFLDFVRDGKGLVLFHAATACFADWPEFDRLVGCAWRDGAGHSRIHEFKVEVVDHEHPVTGGMADFTTAPDELWHRLRPQPTMHVLCTAYSDPAQGGTGENEPVVVCTEYGKGRCLYNVMGHDVRAMEGVGWRTLMLRGTEWAATGRVTLPLPSGG